MSYHRLPTAPLASRHGGADGGTVDNQPPQGSTYLRPISVQSNGATCESPCDSQHRGHHCVKRPRTPYPAPRLTVKLQHPHYLVADTVNLPIAGAPV